MHPNFIGGNPYAMLGLDALLGVSEANRGLISQGLGYDPYMGSVASGPGPGPGLPGIQRMVNPLAQQQGFRPQITGSNPLLQALIARQAAATYPQMPTSQPARKSGNSLGVNVEIAFNSGVFGGVTGGILATAFPGAGVAGSATQTLQSEFHGLKLSASAVYSGYYTASGGGSPLVVYGSQPGGLASDVLLQGVFVGGFNAQPLPPGTGISDGGVALAAYPPNGLGNGIDMLPGKIGQVVKCPLLIQPSIIPLFTTPSGASAFTLTAARIFLTFFGDNLQ